MVFSKLQILLLLCISIGISRAQDVKLKVTKGTGEELVSPASATEGTNVRLRCTFSVPQTANANKYIYFKAASDGIDYKLQWTCSQPAAGNSTIFRSKDVLAMFNKSIPICDPGSFHVLVEMAADSPKDYRCDTSSVSTEQSEVFELRTHTMPSLPQIKQSPSDSVREGESLNFTCESRARPPPMLSLSYPNGAVGGVVHTPPRDSISQDNSSGNSSVFWSTTADKKMNKQLLKCSVIGHVSERTIENTLTMAVIYGPEKRADDFTSWDLFDEDEKTLRCTFDFNGVMTYLWYKNSVETSNKVESQGEELILKKEDYGHIGEDGREEAIFFCKGTNTRNGFSSTIMKFTLTITLTKPATQAPVNDGTTTTESTLPGYAIGLIVAAAVVVVILAIVLITLYLKKRQHDPAIKKKKAASRNMGSGYVNQNGNNSSSRTPQPDIIRNNYTAPEVPSAPASADYNNRYSQYDESYAPALDDQPRSRKPVAYSMDELNDSLDGPPDMMGGPPGYNTHDSSVYRSYPPSRDYSSYGAAC